MNQNLSIRKTDFHRLKSFSRWVMAICLLFGVKTNAQNLNFSHVFITSNPVNNFNVNDVQVEQSGDYYYVAGHYVGVVDFDLGAGVASYTSTGTNSSDGFVAKYTKAGNLVWVDTICGPNSDMIRKIAVSNDGLKVYATGYRSASSSSSYQAMVLRKYEPNSGTTIWERDFYTYTISSSRNDGYDVAVDEATGGVYVAGTYVGGVDWDPLVAGNQGPSNGGKHSSIIRFGPSGNYLNLFQGYFAQGNSITAYPYATSLARSSNGTVYYTDHIINVSGSFTNNSARVLKLDSTLTTLLNPNTNPNVFQPGILANPYNAAVSIKIKLINDNEILLYGSFAGTYDFNPGSGTNNLTSAGGVDIFAARYNTSDMSYIGAWRIGGVNDEVAQTADFGPSNSIYLGGYFNGLANFNGTTINTFGLKDGFIGNFNLSNGTTNFAKRIGGKLDFDAVTAVSFNANDQYFLLGGILKGENINMNINNGENLVSGSTLSSSNGFVSKYGTCVIPGLITGPATICRGENLTLSFTAQGSNLQYQWFNENNLISNTNGYSGSTTNSLSFNYNGSKWGVYRCRVISNGCDTAFTEPYYLDIRKGLLLHHTYTNGSLTDNSGNNANGSNNGLVSFDTDRFGNPSSSANTVFNNAAFGQIDVANIQGLPTGNKSYTMAIWFNNLAANPSNFGIMGYGPNTTRNDAKILRGMNNSSLNATFWNDPLVLNTGFFGVDYWQHVFVKYDHISGLHKLNSSSRTITNYPDIIAGTFSIGAGGIGSRFFGKLDDPRLFNRAISLTEEDILLKLPNIQTEPANNTKCPGQTAVFAVKAQPATGTTVYFQWFKNGQILQNSANIAGVTTDSLKILNVSFSDTANYYVEVYDSCGVILSKTAKLNVINNNVSITQQPNPNTTVCEGQSVTLNITATSASTLSYQWFRNGNQLLSNNTNSITIPNISASQAGNYTVEISGGTCGVLTSNTANVVVNPTTTITTQPTALTQCIGTNASFTAAGAGTGTLTYQWKKGSNNISGANAATLNLTNISAADAANYSVDVTGTCGTVTSNAVALTVNPATSVATQPSNSSTCIGGNASFTVVAAGTGPFTYQWKKGSNNISGALSATLNITNATAGDAGNYSVEITGTCGTVTSNAATLVVNTSTAINTQPTSLTQCAGTNATFTVAASGAGTLTYVWKKGNNNIAGANTATLNLSNITSTDDGNYTVEVTSNCGTTTSNVATLTVNPLTSISTQPTAATQCVGANASFTVAAAGTGALTYQWKKGSNNITGANSATLNLSNITATDAANYSVDVTGTCGTITSNTVALVVNPLTTITTQPTALTQCAGTNASFTVVGSGAGTLTYQWKKGTNNIAGANAAALNLNNITATDAANYSVDVTGTCGTVTSNVVALAVNPLTTISTQPIAVTQCAGTNATFTVAAAGTGILTYQWKKGSNNIAGANSATLNLSSITATDAANYSVDVTGTCGTITSNTVALIVNPLTTITTQPTALTQCAGTNASFTVVGAGAGTLTYQWKKGTNNITGANAAALNLNNITATDAANYSVDVTGTCGTVTSNVVALAVNPITTISTQPIAVTQCAGTNASFTVAAAGTGTLTYQWKKGANNITGATTATLNLNNITAADAANYSVVVTGTCGNVTSTAVALTVNPLTTITTQPTALTQCPGTNATFSVVAAGTGTLSYQWKKAGANILGAINDSYTINNIGASDVASYTVEITGTCGSVTSNAAALALNTPVSITTQPIGGTICEGAPGLISVSANGSGTLTYQWLFNTQPILGANSSTLTNPAMLLANAGDYSVSITGTCGTVTSNIATIIVNPATVIQTQPIPTTLCEGENLMLISDANGTSPITLQWQLNGQNISGADNDTLMISAVTGNDIGNYSLIATGTCGVDTSDLAMVMVNPIFNETASATICQGDVYNLGTQTLTTAGTFTEVFQTVNGCDSTVVLTLNVNPTFNQTASATICDGDTYTFGTQTLTTAGTFTEIFQTVNGCDSTVVLSLAVTTINTTVNEVDFVLNAVSQTGATYQWIDCNNNNTPIAGQTNNIFEPSADGSYAVVISLNNCSDTSSCFTILGIGIAENEIMKYNIYPNPARNQFTIENAEIGSTVQINDLFGKTIFVGKIYDVKTTIEAERFNNGVYSIMIENNGKIGIQKLIISK